jgi:hypothetical protein
MISLRELDFSVFAMSPMKAYDFLLDHVGSYVFKHPFEIEDGADDAWLERMIHERKALLESIKQDITPGIFHATVVRIGYMNSDGDSEHDSDYVVTSWHRHPTYDADDDTLLVADRQALQALRTSVQREAQLVQAWPEPGDKKALSVPRRF